MRKKRILEIVRRLAPSDASPGVTASEVAKVAGVLRHNASADLNELAREGLVKKGKGRPVRFWAVSNGNTSAPIRSEVDGAAGSSPSVYTQSSCFEEMIGAQGSLRTAVEQAKAAMLYPPRGLPTLIVGPTGSGKSHLAEIMYRYAVQIGRLNEDAPFNVFNCADYAANPQLLLAQLFGYLKGSFTGAEQTTPGLIAQSQNGVLFLDEIHRLPPEGQEMLFLLMDRGVYRMLGDGAVHRSASVTLIAATSEDPHSVLLKTLLRRFPVVIKLPELHQRPLEERLALIEYFLRKEASRIGIPISVSPLVLIALLTFRTTGNVGELQNAVLLGCAKAFLNYIGSGKPSENMPFYLTHLSPQIQLDYLRNHRDTSKAERLVGVKDRLYAPSRHPAAQSDGDCKPSDLYRDLVRRVTAYLDSSLEPNEIRKLIQTDVCFYLRRLLSYADSSGMDMIPHHFLEAVSDFVEEAGKNLGCEFGPDAVSGIALHLAFSTRTDVSDIDCTFDLATHCSREYGVVRRLAHRLEERLGMPLTAGEMSFLALFLVAYGRNVDSERLGVLVIAHGDHTASSMAEVANRLLVEARVASVDMPLSQSIKETLQLAVQRIRKMGKIKGVLLLVDMGSLTGLGAALERATGIPVAVVPLVTTAAVIEAARLVGGSVTNLPELVQAVKRVYNVDPVSIPDHKEKRMIVTTCLTGQGTARKLAAFLTEALPATIRDRIVVKPVDIENGSEITGLLVEGWRGTVIAAVGTVDPKLPGVTFIGMEQILFGEGMQTLVDLATDEYSEKPKEEELSKDEIVEIAKRFAAGHMDSPEGGKFADVAAVTLERLEELLGRGLGLGQTVRWIIHLAFALERLSAGGPIMQCDKLDFLEKRHRRLLDLIEESVLPITGSVTLPRDEIGYLAMIVLNE